MNPLSRTGFGLVALFSTMLPAAGGAAQTGSIVSVGPCHTPTTCEPPPPNSGFTAVASGNYHVLGLKENGSVVAWGLCDVEQCVLPADNFGFVAIDAGDSHSLARRSDGKIVAWGQNDNGELGVPEPNIGYVDMAAGSLHNLALRADGSIVGWGYMARGVLDIPQPNTGWVKIAAGAFRSLGLKADGTIHTWGDCGAPTVPCAVPPPDPRFIDIALHHSHALALRSDGSILAWGDNTFGQLNVPEPNTGFVKIAAGAAMSMGLKADGTLLAWGHINTVPSPNGGYFDMDANQGTAEAVRATTTPACQVNADCSDGLFCNGTESCVNGACHVGTPACNSPFLCRESDDRCVSCLSNLNCDDGLFCNGAETCTASGTCQASSNPCGGLACDEGANMCLGGPELWLTFTDSAAVPGLGTVAPQDIVARSMANGTWSMIFDGSDVGLAGLVIDGMARMSDGSLLLSFTEPASIPGMTGGPNGTSLDDSDIVRFVPTALGPATAGSFVFYFDGSDVGLTTDNEDIDAIALTSSGQLVISTVGSVKANGANGGDTDLLIFSATSLGATTAGSFQVRFDGSDVGLTDGSEDVDAADITSDGTMLLSTIAGVTVPGISGGDEDILRFTPTTLGTTTSGSWSMYLALGSAGIDVSENVGAVELKE